MSAANRFCVEEGQLDTLVIFDHFWQDQNDPTFVDTVTDTGTVLMGDAAGGTVVLTPSDGTVADNDEAYIATPNEVFKIATDKPLYGRARLRFAETTANVMNWAFGFQNAVGANSIVDNGGLKVSGDTVAVYKQDAGGAFFYCAAYCNGTGTATKTSKALATATWYDVEIFVTPTGDGLTAKASYKVDGEYLRDFTTLVPISHTLTYASATEMNMFAGVKLGAATNNDTLELDLWLGKQRVF
jgi:hypothetical protein